MTETVMNPKGRIGRPKSKAVVREAPHPRKRYKVFDLPPDEVLHHFLWGQRQILAVPNDSALATEAQDLAEAVIERHFKKDEGGRWSTETTMPAVLRYLTGEFTNGVMPKEYPDHQEGVFNHLMCFMVVMELMAMECDEGVPVEDVAEKVSPPLSFAEKIRRGYCFPFVEFLHEDKPTVFCASCKVMLDRDLVKTLVNADQIKCPECGTCGGQDDADAK